jgi:hypothetical protein
MGQDWKTLSLVVVVAAIAGWWVVRTLGNKSAEPVARPAVVAPPAVPKATDAPVAAAESPVATPVAKAGDIPVVVNEDAEVAAIQRDLDQLRSALARDQRIEDRLMPRVNDAMDVPGVTTYRRAPDFWEPALAEPKEENP